MATVATVATVFARFCGNASRDASVEEIAGRSVLHATFAND